MLSRDESFTRPAFPFDSLTELPTVDSGMIEGTWRDISVEFSTNCVSVRQCMAALSLNWS